MIDLPSLLLFVASIINILIGLSIFFRNPRSKLFIYYLGLAVALAIWTSTNGLFRILPAESLLPIALMSYFGAILVGMFFALFNAEFTGIRLLPNWAVLAAGCLVAVGSLIPGVYATGVTASRSIVTTDGILVFAAVLAVLLLGGLTELLRYIWRARGLARRQAQIMALGMGIAMAMGLTFNLVLPLFHIYGYVYLGPEFTMVYLGALGYAIIRTRLFDLRLVFARSATYFLLLLSLGAVYSTLVFGASKIVFVDSASSANASWLYTLFALLTSFSFQPLRRFFERATNNVFYRYHYDSQEVINDFSKILVSELDLDRILKRSLTELCESLHIQFGQLIIYNDERVYRVEHYGQLPRRLMVAPELARLDKPMLVADELSGGERKQLMENHGIRLSMTLRTREQFVGHLLLGDKLSGDIYSTQDIDLLEIVGKELAVAILNAKAYAQIQEFNLTLQARVEHATNRLRVANRHLKELDRAKDEFISMASHQLRTPLTTIKGYLSMMQEGDAGKLTKAQQEFVGYAFSSSERMVNLISDLLNVSRLSAGRFLIQTKPTDMVQMIRDEVRQLNNHATTKGIKLIFEPPPEPLPPAEIDDNKTRQVVMNFIDNAIYYTSQGEVRVMLEQSGDRVRLEVRDTGIGVPEAAKKKLFSKFFRADNAQIVRPDGTGLGLYLAKRVVEDQGGTIIFNSVEGRGSTFGFELPFKPVTPIREVAHHGRHHHPK
ncbi:MAG TPA: ATP-binding protein [Candidatus Saccharimonadia bacterium]|nr:ATP-binding protein [Candidatus Saccharimonadia bacterium]